MYLDTAVLVKLLVREPDTSLYANQAQGQLVWSADIALTECYSVLLRKEREGAIAARHGSSWNRMSPSAGSRS